MKICCSPTKTMKCQIKTRITQPILKDKAYEIMNMMKNYSLEELKNLYKCNDKIAYENYNRIQNFPLEEGQALFSYTGLQFKNMQVEELTEQQLEYAQHHLYILSGLYGILKPFDLIGSYRLDLENKIEIDLISTYKSLVSDILKDEIIIDCTSLEYAQLLPDNRIRIEFKVSKNGVLKTEATASKIARGLFINYCIQHQIEDIDKIRQFNEDGYQYDETLSDENHYIYVKK